MRYREVDGGYLIRIEKGEDVVEQIARFVRSKQVPAGFFSGIGAAGLIRCGYYDPASRSYVEREFTGELEILGLNGNLSWLGDEPVAHLHVLFSDEQLRAHGGHLLQARVSLTCEVSLRVIGQRIERKLDEGLGLNLLEL